MFDINTLKEKKNQHFFFLYNYFDLLFIYKLIFYNIFTFRTKKIKISFNKNISLSFLKLFYFTITQHNYTALNGVFLNINYIKKFNSVFNNFINLIYLLFLNHKNILIIDYTDKFIESNTINSLFLPTPIHIKLKRILNLQLKFIRQKKYRLLFKYILVKKKIKFIFFLNLQKKPLWFFFFKKLNIPTGGLIDFTTKYNIYDYLVYVPQLNAFYKYLFLIILYDVYKLNMIYKQQKTILTVY